jgi:hypothetical protein
MNLGSCKITKAAANASLTLDQSQTSFPNQTCPFMIAPLASAFTTPTDSTEIVCGIYISKVTASVNCAYNHSQLGVPAHALQSCRLYFPMYDMEAQKQLAYIQANRNKYVEYEDISYYPYVNLVSGQAINIPVTSQAVDPIGLLVIPMISGSANAVAGNILYPHSSPFTTEPATSSPVCLANFNAQLNLKNVFHNNIYYDWECFLHEILGVNSINGAGSLGLSSGLINQVDWENNKRYYFVNLERHSANKSVGNAISITAQQVNAVPIDLHVFVISRKSVIVDVDSGRLVSMSQ